MFFYTEENGNIWLRGGVFVKPEAGDDILKTAQKYKEKGFDFISVLGCNENTELEGITLLSSKQFSFGNNVIYSIGAGAEPIKADSVEETIERIGECGGLAVWAHPVFSLSSAEELAKAEGLFGAEIHNTECEKNGYARGYSGNLLDSALSKNNELLLLASGDAFLKMRAKSKKPEDIMRALKRGDFYASLGPEIYNIEVRDGEIHVKCSTCKRAAFLGSAPWSPGRIVLKTGDKFRYRYMDYERFVRVEVTDENGKTAYSQPIVFREEK